MPNESAKWLYEQLKKEGYNVGKDQAEFDNLMETNAESRKWAYETATKSGLNVGKDIDEFTSLVAPKPTPTQQPVQAETATAPIPSSADNEKPEQTPAQSAPKQPAWQPSVQEKIRLSHQMHAGLNNFNQTSKERLEQVQRMGEPFTAEGRQKRRAKEFEAQVAGAPTKLAGLTPPTTNEEQRENTEAPEQQQPTQNEQSPVAYGVKYVEGKPVTQWLLPDGSLTTNLVEADQAEGRARTARLHHQFENRMKENGLDPTKEEDVQKQAQLDYEAPMRDVLDVVWAQAEAEDKAADEEYLREAKEYNKEWRSNFRVFGPDGRPQNTGEEYMRDFKRAVKRKETFNLETMAGDVLNKLPETYRQNALQAYQQYYTAHTSELKGRTVQQAADDALKSDVYKVVYQRAVDSKMPQSKTEFLLRKIADQPFLSPYQAMDIAATARTGSWGMNAAEADAMGQYGSEHRVLDVVGTVANMAVDPTTYMSGGVGSAAGKAALKQGGKLMMKKAAKEIAQRYAGSTLTGRILAGVAGGAANFATFEGLKNAQNQMVMGGYINPETGENEGLSAGEILKASGHGLIMGGVTGTLSPIIGNVADKVVKATTSTAGKIGARTGEIAVSSLAEGTIFSVPDWIEGNGDAMDVWTDNMAMMVGFKGQHLIKSAPRVIASLRPIKPTEDRALTQAERKHNRMSFEERVRKTMDASPSDIAFTSDEREELRKAGYGKLADLFTHDDVKKDKRSGTSTEEGVEYVEAKRIGVDEDIDGYTEMEMLMKDRSVSQAARAKAYYMLTGRMLPMGSVVGYTTSTAEDGSVTVEATTANGEVVTSRTFRNEQAAKQEIDNIMRQAELNSVDVGERYREAIADDMSLEAAINEVFPNTDLATVKSIYRAVKAGNNDVTEKQKVLVEKLDAFMAEHKDIADKAEKERPEAIRKSLKEETGIDVDAALRKMPSKRTEAEQAVVKSYIERLFPEEARESYTEAEQADAQRRKERGRLLRGPYENGDNAARTEVEETVDKRTNKDSGMIISATIDGRQVYIVEGDVVTLADGRTVDVHNSSKSIVYMDAQTGEYKFISPDEIDKILDVIDPREELDAEKQSALDENAVPDGEVATEEAAAPQPHYQGERIQGAPADYDEGMELTIRDEDGTEKPATVMGRVRYEGGKFVPDANGNIVEYQINGEVRHEHINRIGERVVNHKPARDTEAEASQQAAQPQSQSQSQSHAEHPTYALNDELTIRDENGNIVRAAVTAPENEDGLIEVVSDTPINGRRVNLFTREHLDELSAQSEREEATEQPQSPRDDAAVNEQVSDMREDGSTGQPQENEANRQLTPLERIPRNENGEPIFEQAESPEVAWDALVEFSGGDATTAKEIADAMVEEKRKALEKAQKLKLKGRTPAEMLASKQANAAELAKAESEYNHWQRMANVEQSRQIAIQAQREADARRLAAERAEAEKAEREAREEAERKEREALEGIPEWHLDTPENSRTRGVRRYGGQMFTRQEPVDGVVGNEVEVKFSQKDLPTGHVVVIEAEQLQPSHIQGQRNPMFFIEEAQPKNRAEGVSRIAARSIAENIRPQEITSSTTAYTGAPTVNARGEVIQGNNRADALRYLWQYKLPEQQQAYKQYLLDNAERLGLDPNAINAMQHPVLVNRLDVDDAEAIRLGQMTAQDTESGGIERLKPKNVAQKLGDGMRKFANILLNSSDDNATFGQLVDRNGEDALNWMNQVRAITPTQYQSAFDSKGNLTPEAKNDLQKVLYQAVFKDGSQLLEEAFERLPAKAQRAILSTAFRDMDSPFAGKMLPEIQSSIFAYNEMMQDKEFASAKRMEDVLRAIELFKRQTALDDRFEQYMPADNFSNFALHLAGLYKASDMSQTTIASYFNEMYDLAQGKKAATLFDEADTTEYALADIIKKVFGIDYKPAKNGNNNVANGGADVALRNQKSQRGQPRGNEPPASGEQNPTGAEPPERRAGAGDDGSPKRKGELPEKRDGGVSETHELNDTEADALLSEMESNAEQKPDLELNPQNWLEQFGEDGVVSTPLGQVKMGENQIVKLFEKGRSEQFGMIKPTLENPQVVIEVSSEAKDGQAERESSWLFIKTFIDKNGEKVYYFKSVTVKKDGLEVSVSSHYDRAKRVKEALKNGKLLYRFNGGAQTEHHPADVSVTVSPDRMQGFSTDKGTEVPKTKQEKGDKKPTATEKNVPTEERTTSEQTPYTIEPTSYTNKKGKTTPMHLVTFGRELTTEEKRAGKELTKESRGWWDSKQGGFMMRSEEAAKELAEMLAKGDKEAIADAQPLSVEDMKAATDAAHSQATKETTQEKPTEYKPSLEQQKQEQPKEEQSQQEQLKEEQPKEEQPKEEQPKEEQPKEEKKSKSKYVNDEDAERFEELRARLRQKLRGQMNMGVDPEIFAIGVEMSYLMLKKGARKFNEFAKNLIDTLGEEVRPYVKAFYNGARELPEMADYEKEMTPYEEVRRFDVKNFDKEGAADIFDKAKHIVREQEAEREAKEAEEKLKAQRNERRREEKQQAAQKSGAKDKNTRKKSVTSQEKQPSLFGDLFDNEESGTDNPKSATSKTEENEQEVHLRPRAEEPGRGRQQSRHNEPLGESAAHENERTDGRGVARRGGGHTMSDTERSGRIPQLPKSEQHVDKRKNVRNNHAERGTDYAPKGEKARIDANLAAIELAKKLLASGATPTFKEMEVLRRYSGWGGLGAAFNEGSPWTPNPINVRLRNLLTPEEYEAAEMSRNSAYYTPASVIDAMWDIAKALGFKGGNILEGSAGIGNIIGLMPTDISERSNIHAVEIDDMTGGILSLLYPDANVEIQGFEKTRIPNGSVDLAITNVPFVTGLHVMDESGDSDLSKKFRDIHDFCIAKNVRKLREGGIGIFITSSGTLDKSQKLRNWLVGDKEGCADVVGVFRMNNQTFGGTAATSDIIIVRKRVNGRKSTNAIDVSTVSPMRTAVFEYNGKPKDLPLLVNRYFIEHPENMGGEMYFGFEQGDNYRPTSIGLFPTREASQAERMTAWVERLANKDWSKEQGTSATEQSTHINEPLGKGVKEGNMLLGKDGNLCIARGGRAVPLELSNKKIKGRTKEECFKDYTEIKDALADVLKYQTEHEDNAGLQPLLDRLNRAYDTFVQRYGHLNKNNNLAWLRNDVDFSSIVALETYSEKGNKDGTRIKTYGKTDVFNRRVVEKESELTPKNVKDGIIASIYEFGRIDPEYIAEKLGKKTADVKKEILDSGLGFVNPTTGQTEVSYEYLSGNVREKLRQAKEANEAAGGAYTSNVKALEAVLPMDIPAHLIEFTLGSSWIDPKFFERYIEERTGLEVKLTNVGGTWSMKEPWRTDDPKNEGIGVRSEKLGILIPGHKLIEAALTNKPITVSKTYKNYDGSTTTETDPAATMACATKIDEIRQDFKDWARAQMQADPDLSNRMEKVYNEQFNNSVSKIIPKDFIPAHFGGAATMVDGKQFQLRQHQAQAVVRSTTQPVLLAHEVGTGKTYTLITAAMEMRRLGTARKPMIVVQNATVGQFVASAKALYPNAKILTLEDADRTAEGRKAFYAKIKFNDWDMIVVPQSVFERIPDSIERQTKFIQDKIEEKMLVLEQMKEADPIGKNMIVRSAEREIRNLQDEIAELAKGGTTDKKKAKDAKKAAVTRQNAEVKVKEMLARETDDTEDFDSMGIDAVLIDEAHEYKHLGFATAMQRGVKGVDPSYSKKSQGVYLKTQAVLEKNGGKNVIFATGTPISNTAAEIWTFMRYLMPADTMKDYGIYYFDDFVRNFGNIQQMMEFSTNGKYKEVNRFAGYVNLPELVRIWSTIADTVLTRDAGEVSEKIPEMEGGKAQDIFLPQTQPLRAIMKFVKAQLDEYDKMSGQEKKENSHIPLTMYGIAKAAAVDPRLVQADAPDDPNSKTNEAVRQTLRSLKDTKDYRGTVAIFADNYQNKASGFNLYEDIRKKLIAAGVPAEQIVIMKSGMSVNKKLELFSRVNSGEVRVIMGSTFTLGTGVNIQERLHTLIHLDAPNRPMDYTQRNGRILRQGNMHKEWGIPVRVLRFGVEDSLDVTAYQRLKTKGAIADSIMNGKELMKNSMENRSLEEEQDIFGDITAQLSGSEYAMLKNQMEREVRKLTAKQKNWEADQSYIHNRKRQIAAENKAAEKRIADNEASLNKVEAATTDKITVGKHSFSTIDEMGDFFTEQNKKKAELQEKVRKNGYASRPVTSDIVVSVGGFDFNIHTEITVETKQQQGGLFYSAPAKMTYSCTELGIGDMPVKGNVIKNAVKEIIDDVISGNDFRERIDAAKHLIERNNAELQSMAARDGVPFQHTEELAKAKEKLAEYEELMIKEMEAKYAKYAEMDKGVEAASNIDFTEEDSEEASAGKEISYHRGDVVTNTTPQEQALLDAVVEQARKAGIEVVTDVEEGQRVLDMANGEDDLRMEAKHREQRVYHGSGADFDHFDHSHMGEGEGVQAYGWGTSGGRSDGASNYVIFNEADAKITDHVRFFKTPSGEAYGYTVGGKIYVDPRIATAETPIHEYAHLWAEALRNGNSKEWANVVELMRGTSVWEEVKKQYPELKTDDEIADEVIAQYSGRRGAERLREAQRKIAEGKGDVFEKADAISALERVKQALKSFWKGVCDFLHIHYTSAEEVADRVLKDLLDGVNPNDFNKGKSSNRVREMGSRTDKKMEQVGRELEGRELTPEQKSVADVFSGQADNTKITINRADGALTVVMRQGNDNHAGAKHSLFGHYGTSKGVITSEDIMRIPKVMEKGERTAQKGNAIQYKYNDETTNTTYTVVTNTKNGREEFADFYTNKKAKPSVALTQMEETSDTPEGAHNNDNAFSAANLLKGVEKSNGTGEKFFEENENDAAESNPLYRDGNAVNGATAAQADKEAQATKRKAAEELGGKLNTKLNIVDDVNSITHPDAATQARMRRAKGWYDPRTGEVTIVTANCRDAEDVAATVAHETIAHKGLREMIGEERYDEFLDETYNHLRDDLKKEVDEAAGRAFVGDATKNGKKAKSYEQHRRQQVDELFGRMAEKPFEEFNSRERMIWHWLKSAVRELLNKFLGTLKLPKWFELGDNELRYILWRSKEHLERGKEHPIDLARDIVKREELGLGHASESIEDTNTRYNEQLSTLTEKNADRVVLDLGRPSGALLLGGVSDKPMKLYGNKVIKKMQKHGFTLDELKDLPRAAAEPIAVFDNYRKDGSRAILTELRTEQGNFLVTLNVGSGEDIDFNIVTSVFGKGEDNIVDWVERGLATYIDKEKALNYLHHSALRAEALSSPRLSSATKVVEDFENPTKIPEKSAMEEAQIEDDVLFRDGDPEEHERGLARDRYERRVKTGWFQTREAMQDSMAGLEEGMKAILESRGEWKKDMHIEDVPDYENPYIGENRLSSVNQDEANEVAKHYFNPLYDEVKKLAKTAAQRAALTDYMMAKHGLERNEVMARREAQKQVRKEFGKELHMAERAVDEGPSDEKAIYALDDVKQRMSDREEELYFANRENDYAGLTALTGEANIADAEFVARGMVATYEKHSDTQALWDKVNAANAYTLQKAYESGLISKQTYDDVSGMYQWYIPLRGFDEQTAEETYAYMNHRDSVINSPIKTAKGRKSKADGPFANMEAMAESAIMQGNRNALIGQRALNFALNHPSDLVSVSNLWLHYDAPSDEWVPVFPDNISETDTAAEVEQKMQDFEARMQELQKLHPNEYVSGQDAIGIPYRVVSDRNKRQHQVVVKRGGVDYVLTINGNPRMAQALNGQTNPDHDNREIAGRLLNFAQKVQRLRSKFATQRNPSFAAANFVRDQIYSNTMAWVKESPAYAARFNANALRCNLFTMGRLISKDNRGKLDMSKPIEKLYNEFMRNGGDTGFLALRGIEERKSEIQKILSTRGWLKNPFTLLGKCFDYMNMCAENAARFTAYMTSRQMGRTIGRSIWDAKEASVNFNKKGAGERFMGAVGQTKAGNAAAFTSGVGRQFYMFWNAAVQGSFGNFFKNVKRRPVKAASMVMLPQFALGFLLAALGYMDDEDDDKNKYADLPVNKRRQNACFKIGDQWITIPLPVEFRVFYGMGELAASTALGGKEMSDGEIAIQTAEQLTQTLPLDFLEGGGGLHAFIPSWIAPSVEVGANMSWTGLPIYKESEFNKNDPEWQKAYASANGQLVGASKWLNEMTGGDDYKKGAVDINPAKVEYLLNSYFSGYVMFVNQAIKTGETAVGERDFEWRSIPIANRLLSSADERAASKSLRSAYFEYKDEYERTNYLIKNYGESAKTDAEYLNKLSDLQQTNAYSRYAVFSSYKPLFTALNDAKKTADAVGVKMLEAKEDDMRQEMASQMRDINKGKAQSVNEAYGRYEEVYKGVAAQIRAARKAMKTDYVEGARIMADIQGDKERLATYAAFRQLDGNLNQIEKFYVNATTPEETALCRQAMTDYRAGMVDVLNAKDEAARSRAIQDLSDVMQSFIQQYAPHESPQ